MSYFSAVFSKRGFTLIELLLVVAVIAVLSASGASLSIKFSQNQSVNTTTQNLSSTLYNARSQAQSLVSIQCTGSNRQFTGMQVVFCKSKDSKGNSCSSKCVANPLPDYELDVLCGTGGSVVQTALQTQSLPSQVTISPDNCSVLFQPFGIPVTGFGKISVNGYGKTQTITVNKNGVIQ